MSLIHTSHTEKERAARRANALRSTGPRSERGKQQSSSNALKFGWFARSHSSMHRAFGEDPSEAARLRDALVRGLRPSNEAQLMLVEDIAVLRMEKTRNQRAQEAVMLANLENLERQRRRQAIHLEDQRPDTPIAEVHEHGLLRAPDSPGKFEQIQHILKVVLDSLDAHAFFDDAQASFEILWGKHPSMRGQMIMNVHADLLARSRQPGFELVSDAEMLRMAEAEEKSQKSEGRTKADARSE